VLILTGLVCTKTVDFLFVKTRRLLRACHEDFCEEEWEKYVALGESDTATPVELRRDPIQARFEKIHVVVPSPALLS
jgi:hypothetical protein